MKEEAETQVSLCNVLKLLLLRNSVCCVKRSDERKPEPVCAVWEWWGLGGRGGGELVLAFGEALCEHTLAQ